jgi:hypothetical protein
MHHTHCQSCGKPIKNPVDRGTNENGTLSGKYCGHCYSMGEFIEPEITAAEMQVKVTGKLREMGLPGFLARLFARKVPKLERWAGAPLASR